MKYAFNTWVYSSFPVWLPAYPLDEAIRRIAEIGYDGVEIGCSACVAGAFASKEKGRAAKLIERLRAAGGESARNPWRRSRLESGFSIGRRTRGYRLLLQ